MLFGIAAANDTKHNALHSVDCCIRVKLKLGLMIPLGFGDEIFPGE